MSTCCNFTTPVAGYTIDPLTTAWQARAIANSGTPSAKTLLAINTFCLGIRAQTYFTKFKTVNVIAPDDFRSAMTPLIVHANDVGIWQACVGGTIGGGNDFVKAANSELGANGWRCDYAVTPSPSTNAYNPTSVFTARDNWGVTLYETTNDGLHGPLGISAGNTVNAGAAMWFANNYFGNTYLNALDDASQIATAFGFYGYHSFNAVSASSRIEYAANSTHAHAVKQSSGAAFTGNLNAVAFLYAGLNNANAPQGGSSNWQSFYAAHDFLTAVESLDLYTRVQALRVAFGTGFL